MHIRERIKDTVQMQAEDIEIVEKIPDENLLLSIARNDSPDLYMLDVFRPGLNGVETIERLHKIDRQSRIIVLFEEADISLLKRLLEYNVKGFISKECGNEKVVDAIQEVYRDKYFLCPKISRLLIEEFPEEKPRRQSEKTAWLTRREKEVLQLIGEGLSNKQIAERLFISAKTVPVHRRNIMSKLHIHNQAGLILYALKEGISNL